MVQFNRDFKIPKQIKFALEYERDPLISKSEFELLEDQAKFKNCTISKYVRDIVLEALAKTRYLSLDSPKIDEFIKEDGTQKHYNEPTLADYQKVHLEFIQNTDLPLDELRRRSQACIYLSKLYDNAYQAKKEAEFDRLREARLKVKLSPHLKNEELGIG